MTHFDMHVNNALMKAALFDIDAFSYLLSNACFPNGDINKEKGQIIPNITINVEILSHI